MTLEAINPDSSSQPSTLVCVSNAEESAIAIQFGCLRAKRRGHHLKILHVLEPTEFQGLSAITDAIREEKEEDAGALLAEMEQLAEEHGIENPDLMVLEDSLSNGILSALEANPNINMIILAINPASHRGPKLMAALTEELGNTIKVPIMMLPGNLNKEQTELLS
ncbi:MAG: universal stress protein [Rickettsiales bacterium]|nr:universal stress protein [Rickettsiales bacterium]